MSDKDYFIAGIVDKYPAELLKNRINYEANVIGVLISDILLLEDTNIDNCKFITKDALAILSLLKTLRKNKCTVCDEVSYLTYASDDIKEKIDELGGFSRIIKFSEVINKDNFDSYLDSLLKSNIIMNMYDYGFNVTHPINVDGKQIIPIRLFNKMTSEEVTDWYTAQIEKFSTGYSSKVLEEEALDLDDAFITSLEEGEESGIPFESFDRDIDGNFSPCLPYFSKQVNGIPNGLTIIGGYSNCGKTTLVIQILMSLMAQDPGHKCMIISNEQRGKNFKIGFMLLILTTHFKYYNLTKTKLINGDLSDTDKEMIKKAQDYWRKYYKGRMYFISIPDSDVDLAIKKMRLGILGKGINTCVYDTFKIDTSVGGDDNTWLSLIKDSRRFEALSRKYDNVQVICTLQLAINTLGKLFLDSSVLSMSKQIKEVADTMILCRTIYSEEFDPTDKNFCRPFKTVKENGEWVDKEWMPEPNNVYRMVFIEKSRTSGNVSSDTGIAYIFHFMGQWGLWHDSAKAKPRHGYIG